MSRQYYNDKIKFVFKVPKSKVAFYHCIFQTTDIKSTNIMKFINYFKSKDFLKVQKFGK